MPSKTIAGLSLIFLGASTALLLVPASPLHRDFRPGAHHPAHDLRLLSAQEINRRTLGLAAAIHASEK